MSSRPIGMNDAGAGVAAKVTNLYPHLTAFWLMATVIWSIHLIAPEILGFSPAFLKYCEPYTPSLPIPVHAALALGGAFILFATWTYLTDHDPRRLEHALLLAAITAGIELLAAWQTIWLRAPVFDIIADPPPDPAAVDGFLDTLAGALAALVLASTLWRGRAALAASHHDRTSAMDELRLAYLFARCMLAVSLALPLYDEGAAWSTVDIYHGPPLTWLVAAALPLGLALACLLDRFRPRPESLPPAPQP